MWDEESPKDHQQKRNALARRCQFRYWFFGHYHDDRVIREKYVLLYRQIIEL